MIVRHLQCRRTAHTQLEGQQIADHLRMRDGTHLLARILGERSHTGTELGDPQLRAVEAHRLHTHREPPRQRLIGQERLLAHGKHQRLLTPSLLLRHRAVPSSRPHSF